MLSVSSYNISSGSTNILYAQTNTRGDVVALYDGDGDIRTIYTYDSWGKLVSVTDGEGNALGANKLGNLNSIRYRGYVYDSETGLYYLQSRYYDPEVGRFLNADDADCIGLTESLLSFNIFCYCENNITLNYDSNGHSITYDLGKGWKYRIDPANTSTKTNKHIHVWNGKENYSQNEDGSPHDGSSGSPPKSIKDKIKDKSGWDWDAKEKAYKDEKNAAQNKEKLNALGEAAVMLGSVYVLYRVLRMLISLMPGLWWTLPFNVAIA